MDICGEVPQLKVDRTGIGHADRFWAAALGLWVMPVNVQRAGGVPKVAKTRMK